MYNRYYILTNQWPNKKTVTFTYETIHIPYVLYVYVLPDSGVFQILYKILLYFELLFNVFKIFLNYRFYYITYL